MPSTDKIYGLSFQCDPPVAVHDLFTDVQDGRILMALLEQLSGCKMVRVGIWVIKIEKNFASYL